MIVTHSSRNSAWRQVRSAVTRACLLSALVVAGAAVAMAQERTDTPLTLSEAVDLALRNHPATREARAGAAAAVAEVGVARTAYLPRLDLLWQANHATRNNVFG